MASLNKVMLIGNLGADPELRYTPTLVPILNYDIHQVGQLLLTLE